MTKQPTSPGNSPSRRRNSSGSSFSQPTHHRLTLESVLRIRIRDPWPVLSSICHLPAILAFRMLSWVSSRVLSHCMRAEKQARSGPAALSGVALLNNLQRGKKLVAQHSGRTHRSSHTQQGYSYDYHLPALWIQCDFIPDAPLEKVE